MKDNIVNPVNPRVKISLLWLLLMVGGLFHVQFELSLLFVKSNILIEGATGEFSAIVHYYRILFVFLPMLFALGVLYLENKIFKISLLVVSFLLLFLNGSHLLEEVQKKPFDLSQGILLTSVLLINVMLVLALNKWRLSDKEKA